MNKKIIFLIVPLLCLTGCDDFYHVTSDFDFIDDKVNIVDSLESVTFKKAHVVFLYGQSNAEGVSTNAYLEKKDKTKYDEYVQGYDNVYINYYCGAGGNTSNYSFQKCTLGCGTTNLAFGPEMGIAEKMKETYPYETTFILKWTYGATALRNNWLDNHQHRGELYNRSMDFSLKCLSYLKNKGYEIAIDGICWMQGESDSYINDGQAYYRDTVAFATLLRHDLYKFQKEIKYIDATINDDEGMWIYPKPINEAKKRFAGRSSLNYCLDTQALGITTRYEPEETPDYGHYDSLSMVKLGQEFGKVAGNKK